MMCSNPFMGYKINAMPLHALVADCSNKIALMDKNPTVFSCANPHALATAESRGEFRCSLQNADILVTDGVGVALVGSVLGLSLGPRITGSDFFSSLMLYQNSIHSKVKTRVFFFGSSLKVLDLLRANLAKTYPFIEICGCISPPYGDWSESENSLFIEQINAANPDILWVGMTAPKQELWTDANRKRLKVSVIGNVGAVFDFVAGTYERAPEWARKLGLEWLVRLCKEPRRMWRRNLISPAIFIVSAIRSRLFGDIKVN